MPAGRTPGCQGHQGHQGHHLHQHQHRTGSQRRDDRLRCQDKLGAAGDRRRWTAAMPVPARAVGRQHELKSMKVVGDDGVWGTELPSSTPNTGMNVPREHAWPGPRSTTGHRGHRWWLGQRGCRGRHRSRPRSQRRGAQDRCSTGRDRACFQAARGRGRRASCRWCRMGSCGVSVGRSGGCRLDGSGLHADVIRQSPR